MELRTYWRIFMRRWWIAAVLMAATPLLSWLFSPLTSGSSQATLRVLITLPAQPPQGPVYTYDRYYSFLSTEYVVDDIVEVVNSQSFRAAVEQEAGGKPSGSYRIDAQPRRERAPRIVTVTVTADSPAEAQRLGDATSQALTSRAPQYFSQPGLPAPTIQLIDPPTVSSTAAGGRSYVNLGLRALAGLLAGIGFVFFLNYLDTRLHDPEEAARRLGLPLLAVIPRANNGK